VTASIINSNYDIYDCCCILYKQHDITVAELITGFGRYTIINLAKMLEGATIHPERHILILGKCKSGLWKCVEPLLQSYGLH
jgi:hypothetical protein